MFSSFSWVNCKEMKTECNRRSWNLAGQLSLFCVKFFNHYELPEKSQLAKKKSRSHDQINHSEVFTINLQSISKDSHVSYISV